MCIASPLENNEKICKCFHSNQTSPFVLFICLLASFSFKQVHKNEIYVFTFTTSKNVSVTLEWLFSFVLKNRIVFS